MKLNLLQWMRMGNYGQLRFSPMHPNKKIINDGDHHESMVSKAGKSSAVSRTVQMDMNVTMRFTPANFEVKAGETLEPSGEGDVIWQFTNAGSVAIACLPPGHYDAGMKGDVTVSAK